MTSIKEIKSGTHVFLPLTETEQRVVPSHLTYKILMAWKEDAHDWLEDHLVFEDDWFSLYVENVQGDYEYYYFAQESDAVRFMLTWL